VYFKSVFRWGISLREKNLLRFEGEAMARGEVGADEFTFKSSSTPHQKNIFKSQERLQSFCADERSHPTTKTFHVRWGFKISKDDLNVTNDGGTKIIPLPTQI
jgi:hypothetical protein